MALIRRVAALGAAVAAARQYARQNPEKVNRYADQAASFIDQRTNGRFRRQIDGALRQVRKETSVPGRTVPGPSQAGQYGPQQSRYDPYGDAGPSATRRYPSERADR
ncbi:antitoxin [Actinomycetospora termitidis]|uniref:Antitoxin n=1 Tax=Actinomycetospora termitidis TaxID=3053470 RepID=A0ABT7MKP7_9PSEU|nr:antitoxin [Actinomycetospora sp. Odt1-22]MDL5159928.1 antitoxin [Actinomycetospora sp. Odt1-22]